MNSLKSPTKNTSLKQGFSLTVTLFSESEKLPPPKIMCKIYFSKAPLKNTNLVQLPSISVKDDEKLKIILEKIFPEQVKENFTATISWEALTEQKKNMRPGKYPGNEQVVELLPMLALEKNINVTILWSQSDDSSTTRK
jgi:hypothetical protein